MSPLELTKLHFSEIKEDICVEFGVMCSENYVALQCSNNQLIILDLLDSSAVLTDLPYNLYYAEIPQINNLDSLKKADLKKLYNNCKLLEQHRLALEPSCVTHFSCEPPKVNALQFKRVPWHSPIEAPIAAIVTASGLCRILRKIPSPSRLWSEICNVNELISNEISKNDRSGEFYLNKSSKEYGVTAATWHTTEPILFVSFESGHVAVLVFFNAYFVKLKKIVIGNTNLEKVCDIISFDHYLLVSCRDGFLQLFSINYTTNNLCILSPMEVLWNKRDNMVCSKIFVTNFAPGIYLVVLNKGSHILVFMLSAKGKVLCCKELHIGRIKVTGVKLISSFEFIVTSITSTVHYFRVDFPGYAELRISEQIIKADVDTSNLGILGLVPSRNTSILTFILIRNGEYSQQSKYMHSSIFINICKLGKIDSMKELKSPSLDEINQNHELMDIICNMNMNFNKYSAFSDIKNTKLPVILDEGFLLQLQMKFVLVANLLSSQRFMHKQNKESTIIAHKFLSIAIQITHIIYRLKYLYSLESTTLTSFQHECINLFQAEYIILILKFKRCLPDKHILERTKEMYLNFFSNSHNAYITKRENSWCERCLYCNNLTNANTMMCNNNHKVKRCYISYTQLPIISSRHCPRCQHYILENESLLQELFAVDEIIRCSFCRSLFVRDCI